MTRVVSAMECDEVRTLHRQTAYLSAGGFDEQCPVPQGLLGRLDWKASGYREL
jgi:hypothetical protein